jgi:hypothetical protein
MPKRKEIHVDQLIVKANEVIIIDESRRHRRNPWWEMGRGEQINVDDLLNDVDGKDNVKKEVDDEVKSEINDRDNEENRPRFRWF